MLRMGQTIISTYSATYPQIVSIDIIGLTDQPQRRHLEQPENNYLFYIYQFFKLSPAYTKEDETNKYILRLSHFRLNPVR